MKLQGLLLCLALCVTGAFTSGVCESTIGPWVPFDLCSWFSREEKRIIKLSEDTYRIVSESEKLRLKRQDINFIDITFQASLVHRLNLEQSNSSLSWFSRLMGAKDIIPKRAIPTYKYPPQFKYVEEVKGVHERIDKSSIHSEIVHLSSYFTRYYKSPHGVESTNDLLWRIQQIIEPNNGNVFASRIDHDGFDQYSIIVTIPGVVSDKVILGAHIDSKNILFPSGMFSPGADDNASGTATLMEVLRLINGSYLRRVFRPYNTLEFHFYAAEEGGLLGSYDIFSRYSSANETVLGMLQHDMTGSTARSIDAGVGPHFGIISDYVSVYLNHFVIRLIGTYTNLRVVETSCGYGCSDHASAYENGYPSSSVIESHYNYISRFIHTVGDTVDRLDLDHIVEHVKLSVAFVYELSMAEGLY